MTDAVLDASAALAVINSEPGAAEVWSFLPGAYISAVNVAEVSTKLIDGGLPDDLADAFVQRLGLTLVPFDRSDARGASGLRPATRSAGLSLGDRACLALARRMGITALTADRAWAELDTGVEVHLIR